MTTPTNDLRNTSVSHATLRLEDLIPAFTAALKTLTSSTETPDHDHRAMIDAINNNMQDADYYETETARYDLEDLFDALNEYAPDRFYFGAHPGDGSDFGFWQCEDFDDDGGF